jgi:hypothetical protein
MNEEALAQMGVAAPKTNNTKHDKFSWNAFTQIQITAQRFGV